MGFCCKCLFVSTLLSSILCGLLLSGFVANNTPIFQYLDDAYILRGKPFKGLTPAFHKGVEYGYTFEELQAQDLTGQVVLVTGGNTGLGYWTAFHLAKQKAQVVIACRSKTKCKAAAEDIFNQTGQSVDSMTLDLASFKSIIEFTKAFKAKYYSIDSLVLNAGVAELPFTLTEDGIEMSIGINHFGHFLVARELLPLVKTAAEQKGVATVVVVTSAANFNSYPSGILPTVEAMNDPTTYSKTTAYGQSKLANVLFAQELAAQVKKNNVLVNSVHPGVVTTQLQKHSIEAFCGSLGESFTKAVMGVVESFSWKAEEAALSQIYLAVGKGIRESRVTGRYFHPIARETEPDLHARNVTLQRMLWKLTEAFIDTRLTQLI